MKAVPLTHETSTVALREAAQVLRGLLARLEQERVGELAACYIDRAMHLLEEEAVRLAAGKPVHDTGPTRDLKGQ